MWPSRHVRCTSLPVPRHRRHRWSQYAFLRAPEDPGAFGCCFCWRDMVEKRSLIVVLLPLYTMMSISTRDGGLAMKPNRVWRRWERHAKPFNELTTQQQIVLGTWAITTTIETRTRTTKRRTPDRRWRNKITQRQIVMNKTAITRIRQQRRPPRQNKEVIAGLFAHAGYIVCRPGIDSELKCHSALLKCD